MLRPRRLLIPILVLAFAHGLFFVVAIPPWDLYDEGTHLAYALVLRDERRIPHLEEMTRVDIVDSEIATDRWSKFRIGEPDTSSLEAMGLGGRLYQGYQPPLYYVMIIPATYLGGDVLGAMYAARMLGPFLLVILTGITWILARLWFPSSGDLAPVIAAGIVALTPAAAEAAGRVNNDLLAATLIAGGIAAATLLVQRPTLRRAAGFSALAAGAILVKSHGMLLLVIAAAVAALLWRRGQLTAPVAAMTLLPGTVVTGFWTAWTWRRYGVLSGPEAFLDFAQPFETMSPGGFGRALTFHTWSSYWSSYDGGMIETATGLGLLAIVLTGMIALVWRGGVSLEVAAIAAVAGVSVLALLWYGNASGLVYPQGRIILPIMPAVAVLTTGGWSVIADRRLALIPAMFALVASVAFLAGWFIPFFILE